MGERLPNKGVGQKMIGLSASNALNIIIIIIINVIIVTATVIIIMNSDTMAK